MDSVSARSGLFKAIGAQLSAVLPTLAGESRRCGVSRCLPSQRRLHCPPPSRSHCAGPLRPAVMVSMSPCGSCTQSGLSCSQPPALTCPRGSWCSWLICPGCGGASWECLSMTWRTRWGRGRTSRSGSGRTTAGGVTEPGGACLQYTLQDTAAHCLQYTAQVGHAVLRWRRRVEGEGPAHSDQHGELSTEIASLSCSTCQSCEKLPFYTKNIVRLCWARAISLWCVYNKSGLGSTV